MAIVCSSPLLARGRVLGCWQIPLARTWLPLSLTATRSAGHDPTPGDPCQRTRVVAGYGQLLHLETPSANGAAIRLGLETSRLLGARSIYNTLRCSSPRQHACRLSGAPVKRKPPALLDETATDSFPLRLERKRRLRASVQLLNPLPWPRGFE